MVKESHGKAETQEGQKEKPIIAVPPHIVAQGEKASMEYVASILNSGDHPLALEVKAQHDKYCKDHGTPYHESSWGIIEEEDEAEDDDSEDMLLSFSDDQLAEAMRGVYSIGVPDSFGPPGEDLKEFLDFLARVKDLPNAEMAKKVRDFITTHQAKSVENDSSEITMESDIQVPSIGHNEDNAKFEKTDDAEI